jgi:hypothetical protein
MNRKFFSAVLLALAMLASSSVFAGPSYAWSQTYYSDASMTVAIGGKFVSCKGTVYSWGITSMFRGPKEIEDLCPVPGN